MIEAVLPVLLKSDDPPRPRTNEGVPALGRWSVIKAGSKSRSAQQELIILVVVLQRKDIATCHQTLPFRFLALSFYRRMRYLLSARRQPLDTHSVPCQRPHFATLGLDIIGGGFFFFFFLLIELDSTKTVVYRNKHSRTTSDCPVYTAPQRILRFMRLFQPVVQIQSSRWPTRYLASSPPTAA
jgi:hypothetical protein